MDKMRTPFFIAAVVFIALVVLIELGSTSIISRLNFGNVDVAGTATESLADSLQYFPDNIREPLEELIGDDDAADQINNIESAELDGFALPYLALTDGLILFTVGLIAMGLVMPDYWQGKTQGAITLVFSILIIMGAIAMALAAFAAVLVMIVLLLSIPFGTIVYLIKYGSFDRSSAAAILSLLMLLRIGFVICLLLAQQSFIKGKGLMLVIITGFVASIVVTFLHGMVPGILVSITDAVAGIIVAIIAIIWAIILLIGSIISIFKAVT